MSDFKLARILAPTDQSAFSQKAIGYARDLAKHFGAELHVLRVMADEDKALAQYAVTGIIDAGPPGDDYNQWLAELVGAHRRRPPNRIGANRQGCPRSDRTLREAP